MLIHMTGNHASQPTRFKSAPASPIPLYMFYDIYIFMVSFRTPAEQPGLSNNKKKRSTNAPQ